MSLAGPAFGLRANDGEGLGYGRCVGILTGGPSGGHTAPVLDAVQYIFKCWKAKLLIEPISLPVLLGV